MDDVKKKEKEILVSKNINNNKNIILGGSKFVIFEFKGGKKKFGDKNNCLV